MSWMNQLIINDDMSETSENCITIYQAQHKVKSWNYSICLTNGPKIIKFTITKHFENQQIITFAMLEGLFWYFCFRHNFNH